MVELLPPAAPLSGWWEDQPGDSLLLFHGTDICNVFAIADKGLLPITGRCWLSPCYRTARDYSTVGPDGGDTLVIQRKKPLYLHPNYRYAVAHFNVPRDYVHRYAIHSELRPLLKHRELYEASEEPDSQFYYLAELSFADPIPPEFLTGYSLPYAWPYDQPIYRISR